MIHGGCRPGAARPTVKQKGERATRGSVKDRMAWGRVVLEIYQTQHLAVILGCKSESGEWGVTPLKSRWL
jgi:hypothetical protein